MAYEMVMPYHLHMPSYFLETFTEYPFVGGAPCFYRSIFGNVVLNVTIVRCAVFGFFNFTGENRTNAESKLPLI